MQTAERGAAHHRLARAIRELRDDKRLVVLVSSGAIALGARKLGYRGLGMEQITNPRLAAKLKAAADAGWANLVRVEGAAKAAKNTNGVFTPGQLNTAIQQADRSVRGRAVARGQALMQDLSNAGQNVIGNKVPNSFTTDRALLAGGGLGAGFLNPAIPLGLAGGGLLYTQPAQRFLSGLLSSRPQSAQAVADTLRQASPSLGLLGGHEEEIHVPGFGAATKHLVVDRHLFDVERDVLLCLPADLLFELLGGHHRDGDLADDHRLSVDADGHFLLRDARHAQVLAHQELDQCRVFLADAMVAAEAPHLGGAELGGGACAGCRDPASGAIELDWLGACGEGAGVATFEVREGASTVLARRAAPLPSSLQRPAQAAG